MCAEVCQHAAQAPEPLAVCKASHCMHNEKLQAAVHDVSNVTVTSVTQHEYCDC